MRALAWGVGILLTLALILWAGAEFALVHKVRSLARDGEIGLENAQPLYDPARIGAGFSELSLPLAEGRRILLSDLTVWVAPWSWNVFHAELPSRTRIGDGEHDRWIMLEGATGQARISPTRRMALSSGAVRWQTFGLGRGQIAGPGRLDLKLTNYGSIVPAEVQAAYRLTLGLTDIDLPALVHTLEIAMPDDPGGLTAIDGAVTLWLKAPLGPMAGADNALIGISFDGLRIAIDESEATLWGHISRQESGDIGGELAADTRDLRGFVLALAGVGLVPQDYAHLAASALETVAEDAVKDAPEAPVDSSPNLLELRGGTEDPFLPAPEDGMTRIPLRIAQGQVFLGNLALGKLLQDTEPDTAEEP